MIFFICRSVLPDCPVSAASGVLAPLSMMKKLLLFVALLGLALPLRAQDDKALAAAAAKADLKLMSFNIRYYKPGADGDNGWVARRAACLEMIRAESPDVIGFQEPHRPQIDYLKGRRIHVHPSCVNLMRELQQWKWRKDEKRGIWLDEPVPFFDDAIAALRYAIEGMRKPHGVHVYDIMM